ncbi:helix-turn-helix domain-containing protein [Bdellovibrio sp. HCB290]|uniref:helix-turn-helix domain-containing protein n=1 Tax=Bdellovibrio sp. HCB290 TaxID=3394356 RepID=UPI0039B697B5
MTEVEIQKIKTVLKNQLKKNKMTYEALAEELDVSVPTIKRWLGDAELGLSELLRICSVLNLNLAEIQALVDQEKKNNSHELTLEQQAFFAKNMNYLGYYSQIIDGRTPEEIAKKFGLTKLSTDKYLVKLEKIGVIKVTGKQKVKSAFPVAPSFGTGALSQAVYSQIIRGLGKFFETALSDFMRKLKTSSPEELGKTLPANLTYQRLRLTRESYTKWSKDYYQGIRQLETISKIEEKAYDEKDLVTVVMSDSHCAVPHDYFALENLDTLFGKIVNI